MKKNSSIKHILKVDNKTFRALHDCVGFDFEQDFSIIKLGGPFTINQALKKVAAAGYDSTAAVALILREAVKGDSWRNGWRLVTLEGRRVNIEHDYADYWRNERRRVITLKTFYTKGGFEEMRKLDTCEAYAITQRAEYIKKPAAVPVDWRARFKLIPSEYSGHFDLQMTGEKGRRFDYFSERYGVGGILWPEEKEEKQAGAAGIIDKSGYLVMDRRREWKRRAAALRAAREKAAADAQDHSGRIEELRRMIDEKKRDLIGQFEAATTSDELYNLEKALSLWGGFGGTVRDFEEYQRKATAKKYSSPSEAERAYNNIFEKLAGKGMQRETV